MAWRSRARTTAAAAADSVPDEIALDSRDLFDPLPFAPKTQVPVDGLFEATTSCTWDDPVTGWPVYLRGPGKDRPGTIAQAGSPVLAARRELFRPLRISVDLPASPSQ